MLAMYFFNVKDSAVVFYILAGVTQFFFSGFNTAIYAIIPDCVEYGEWKTGLRNDGFQYAFVSLGNDSFFRKVNIHIIQCDDQIQTDQKITCEEELKSYMEKLELKGEGGTDFRPAFAYVDEMIRQHAFEHLRGMIYFTDGRGIYPAKRPVYETAFVFMEEEYEDVDVPPWAIKIILEEGQDF